MDHPILSTISFSKLFMVAFVFSAFFLSPAHSREVPIIPLPDKGQYSDARADASLTREPFVTPPSPRSNATPPGGML